MSVRTSTPAVGMRSQRRYLLRTYGAGSLVLILLAVVAPTTPATAQSTFESRVMSVFETGPELATTAGFPTCIDRKTNFVENDPAYTDYPATSYRSCGGEVKSFDGLELDARVNFPTNASGPLPLVVLMHGWGGNRNGMQGNDPTHLLSPARFLAKGYATVVYTARGWQASCGSADAAADIIAVGGTDVPSQDGCLEGHTHIAERRFEVRDTQHLLGRLVDAGVADPQRLAATGESYGAGQSWLLATAMPWDTPAFGTRMIQLAAAVPYTGWTDLFGALAPNGRATDGLDQSASHEEPFGVVKQRFVEDTYRAGGIRLPSASEPYAPFSGARYNTTKPDELHSYFDGWMNVFNAGEPHDTKQAKDLPGAFRGKSAYYPVADPANDYLTALTARRVRPVPIFAVQGWTDFVFPAVETLQMYRKLKAAHSGYPMKVLLGDLGHGSQSPGDQVKYLWQQAGNFIDAHLGVATDGVPVAASFPTLCTTDRHVPLVAESWDTLAKNNPLTFSSGAFDAFRETDSTSSNREEEMASDPTANTGRCIERPADSRASGAFWRWEVSDAFTMLGLPSVTLPYAIKGHDATVVAKLWDVGPPGPDQKKVLVTRGVYRLSAPGQEMSSGTMTFQLFGNHWRFEEGHTMELEVGQTDRPFLRPDNFHSSIAYDGVDLRVPQAKS